MRLGGQHGQRHQPGASEPAAPLCTLCLCAQWRVLPWPWIASASVRTLLARCAATAGAFGCTVSGAGPTAVAIVSDPEVRGRAGQPGRCPWGLAQRLSAKLAVHDATAARWPHTRPCCPHPGPAAPAALPQVGERVKEAMVAAFKAAGQLEVNSAKVVRLDNEGAKRV